MTTLQQLIEQRTKLTEQIESLQLSQRSEAIAQVRALIRISRFSRITGRRLSV